MNTLTQPCSATRAEIDHDAYRDAQDVVMAQRETYAESHDWNLDAEATMVAWTDAEWAENLRELPDSEIANMARISVRLLTSWEPRAGKGGLAGLMAVQSQELSAGTGLHHIRAQQADLAREHYLATGELG